MKAVDTVRCSLRKDRVPEKTALSLFSICDQIHIRMSFSVEERPTASCMSETYTAECLALRDVHLALFWVSNETSSHAQTILSL